jgi:hypothetical protein
MLLAIRNERDGKRKIKELCSAKFRIAETIRGYEEYVGIRGGLLVICDVLLCDIDYNLGLLRQM